MNWQRLLSLEPLSNRLIPRIRYTPSGPSEIHSKSADESAINYSCRAEPHAMETPVEFNNC